MRRLSALTCAVILPLTLTGCDPSFLDYYLGNTSGTDIETDIDFSASSAANWDFDYADYTSGAEPSNISFGLAEIPDSSDSGYLMQGTNEGSEVFLYVKKQLTGFKADTTYDLTFSLTYFTNAGVSCSGGQGELVTVKAGASVDEPETVEATDGSFQLSVDKGSRASDGDAAVALGNLGASDANCSGTTYATNTLDSTSTVKVTSDDDGNLWVFFGLDSAYSGEASAYLTAATVTAKVAD